MSKDKMTPGPWTKSTAVENFEFARQGDYIISGPNGEILALVLHDAPPIAKPNATAIEALPALVEAAEGAEVLCEELLKRLEKNNPNRFAIEVCLGSIRSAIKRAKGDE